MADFFKAQEVPEIRKITTLLRLDRLNRAIVANEELALAVRFFQQGQALAIRPNAGVFLDERRFAHSQMSGNTTNLGFA